MHDIQYPPELATLNTMLIGSDPVPAQSGAEIEIRDPATNRVIGSLPRGDASDIDRAVTCARQATQGEWRKLSPQERARIQHGIADGIRGQMDLFTQVETIDVGKPLSFVSQFSPMYGSGATERSASE